MAPWIAVHELNHWLGGSEGQGGFIIYCKKARGGPGRETLYHKTERIRKESVNRAGF